MKINFKKYKVYIYTNKELSKKFTKSTLDKYGKKLAFIYQNGLEMEKCSDEEIEEQFSLFNGLDTYEDFQELFEQFPMQYYKPEIGEKIIAEEILDISQKCREAIADEFLVQKLKSETFKDLIRENCDRLVEILESDDYDIKEFLKDNQFTFIEELEKYYEQIEVSNLTAYMQFYKIYQKLFKYYIQITHVKTDAINLTKRSLINDQLYGAAGAYDSVRRVIQACPSSAVSDLRFFKKSTLESAMDKARLMLVCKEIVDKDKDLGDFQILKDFSKGKTKDIEKVRELAVKCLENGIINLLCFKHNINLLDDERNSKRAAELLSEAESILKYSEE